MKFDLPTIKAMVDELAALIIPGWQTTVELAPSIEANHGALACVYSTPERQIAHVVVAPHPPNESPRESVAHELTHSCLSPLTKLIEWSPAAVMIEEQIVERLGKLIATLPAGMARAMMRAIQNPRTQSAEVRKRISALATRQRNEGKKRMDYAMFIAALEAALEAEDPKTAIQSLLEKVKGMQGDGGPSSAPAREDKSEGDKAAPAMREEDMPAQYRQHFRSIQRSSAMMLADTIRMRLHTARTVDSIVLDADTENELSKCKTVEQFEREFALVKRMASKGGEQQRARSGVVAGEDKGDKVPAGFSIDELTKDGLPRNVAQMIHDESKTNLEGAKKMRTAARARLTREDAKKGGK